MNTCYNCLDRHIERGKGRHTALIYDSPLTGKIEMYSYQNLQNLVRTERGNFVVQKLGSLSKLNGRIMLLAN